MEPSGRNQWQPVANAEALTMRWSPEFCLVFGRSSGPVAH
jgi:hypothetical protein